MARSSVIQTGLPETPTGIPDELFNILFPIYTAIHNLERYLSLYAGTDGQPAEDWPQLSIDQTMFIGNMSRWYVEATEAMSFGQVVSAVLVGATTKVQLANATNNTRKACGIVTSEGTVAAGQFVEVKVGMALITGITGMIPASRYWLNTSNGQIVNVAPVAAGNIEQYLGWSMTSNRLLMCLDGNYIQH